MASAGVGVPARPMVAKLGAADFKDREDVDARRRLLRPQLAVSRGVLDAPSGRARFHRKKFVRVSPATYGRYLLHKINFRREIMEVQSRIKSVALFLPQRLNSLRRVVDWRAFPSMRIDRRRRNSAHGL